MQLLYRLFLFFSLAASLPATIIGDIRGKLSAGDLGSADALAADFCSLHPDTSECAAAWSWLARGAEMMGHNEAATAYAQTSLAMAEKLLRSSRLESDAFLLTALGASLETQARLLAKSGSRDQALQFLERQKAKWTPSAPYALSARLQKVIHLLSLESKPAPVLPPGLKGKTALLFLWAHWCSDCKAQVAALVDIQRKYGDRITLLAPTRLYGSVGANEKASRAEEEAEIARVWAENYAALGEVTHPIDDGFLRAYGVSSTPTLVLVDRQGIVRIYRPSRLSVAELDRQIAKALQN
jgi:thiol-disulfide isomerase/thioredoxin